jgi:60 kDa SS-A/Ro ribonucleoprotein
MANYAQHVSSIVTPQSEAARPDQVQNNAGGYVFPVDKWVQLDRFLIQGCEGGSYYVSERKMTRDNAQAVEACLLEDGPRAVRRIVEISEAGRAPKNDPAIFCLALALASKNGQAADAAAQAMRSVCRTGDHLFNFVETVTQLRGWGPRLRRAVAGWYNGQTAEDLVYQVMKYQQRSGRSHRDVLRQAHVMAATREHEAIYRWLVAGRKLDQRRVERRTRAAVLYESVEAWLPVRLGPFEELRRARDPKEVARLVRQHHFTHEMVPTEVKKSPVVWEALLEKMPVHAVIRQLSKLTIMGLVAPLSNGTKLVTDRLTNAEALKRARVHPITVLMALKAYQLGRAGKNDERRKAGKAEIGWTPVPAVIDALDDAFYKAFQAVEPTGKRRLIALDVSGSMTWHSIAKCDGLTPRMASAALAMVTVKTEPNWHVIGFTTGADGQPGGVHSAGDPGIARIDLSKSKRLDDVIRSIEAVPAGGTDCSLPMRWAEANRIEVDSFEIYTDNETWAGPIHPFQALQRYRRALNIPAKCMVVGMESTGFSIADPSDAGMLDVVGFDAAAPAIMAEFVRGQAASKCDVA